MKTLLFLPMLALLAVVCPWQTDAQVLLDFGFDNNGNNIDESTTVPWEEPTAIFDANVQGWSGATEGLTIGSGLTSGGNGSDQYRVVQSGTFYPTSLANAISSDAYFSFTVAPDSGFLLDMQDLVITFSGGGSLANRPDRGTLFSSVDGFTSTSDAIETQLINQTTNTFDLSDAEFDALSTTEFRVYVWRNDGTEVSGGSIFFLDSANERWTLNGSTVAIPEASTVWLCLLGGVGLLLLRRKRAA